jgi:hypothetical protein
LDACALSSKNRLATTIDVREPVGTAIPGNEEGPAESISRIAGQIFVLLGWHDENRMLEARKPCGVMAKQRRDA